METPNMSYIRTLSGGDKTFEEKLIAIIKSEFPTEKEVYFNNIKLKKFKEASENVHKLKHKISILGLKKSYHVAAAFENNLKENKSSGKKDFDAILQTMTNFIETL